MVVLDFASLDWAFKKLKNLEYTESIQIAYFQK